ncbi:MAG: hypothetical protein ABSC55_26670 [Syntrophorhabdales bacterium]
MSRQRDDGSETVDLRDHGSKPSLTSARYWLRCDRGEVLLLFKGELPGTHDWYGKKGLLAGIPSGIRVSHLDNFATLLDLMGVPMSLRVRSYDKSIFSLTAEDNRVRYSMSGSLHGSGDYVVKMIPTPPDAGWGVSRPVGKGTRSE